MNVQIILNISFSKGILSKVNCEKKNKETKENKTLGRTNKEISWLLPVEVGFNIIEIFSS